MTAKDAKKTLNRGLDAAKVLLNAPQYTAQSEPNRKLINLPSSTKLSMDLWTREPGHTVPKERGNL